MSDIDIIKFYASKEWINFDNYLNNKCFVDAINYFRLEDYYTNYIYDLLKEDNNYNLGIYPFKQLIKLLFCVSNQIDNKKFNIFGCNIELDEIKVQKQIDAGRLDLFAKFKINNEKFLLILENKFYSREEKNQCKKYKEYFENSKEYQDYKKIYVYLSLIKPEKLSVQDGEFIIINYQQLIDFVVEPSYNKCDNNYKIWLDDFLSSFKVLSIQREIDYLDLVIPSKLKQIVIDLWINYKEILEYIFKSEVYRYDENYNSLMALYNITGKICKTDTKDSRINKLLSSISLEFKNTTRYKYDGKSVFNTTLVYHVLYDLIKNKKIQTKEDLECLPENMLKVPNEYYPTYISQTEYNNNSILQEHYRLPRESSENLIIENEIYYYKNFIPKEVIDAFVYDYNLYCLKNKIENKISQ